MPRSNESICPVARQFHIENYTVFFEDAERREKSGQKQKRCAVCDRFVWPDHRKACPNFKLHHDQMEYLEEPS